tara:strand:- start:768 stop:1994 length:1227 start_codon:yes stop_codon:yes gene_type:complete
MLNHIKSKLDFSLIVLFSIYPIAVVSGNFLINSSILIIGSLFLIRIFKKDTYLFQNKKVLYLLLFFFTTLVINLIFSNNFNLSYPRVLKFIFIIPFILSFSFLVKNSSDKLEVIYKFWTVFFLVVVIDLIIEFFMGKNILGQSAGMPGRLASFTGEESVIGNFFFGFCLVFLSYFFRKTKKISLNLIFATCLVIISFLIGERANFIRTFFAISLFIFFIYKIDYKIKILSIIFILISSYLVFQISDSDYKVRYFKQIKVLFVQDGLTKFLENSTYGAHRNVAKEIFLDNPIFGVGIKNFRVESSHVRYNDLDHKNNQARASNHPHELYYEFLSETGIFGLFSFLIFIILSIVLSLKNYFKTKNIYQFSAIIFIVLSILPIIPTGSFLSTFTSSIFWINYAIMMGYNNE